MKIQIVSKMINGEEVPVNAKGCAEVEIELNDIGSFSDNAQNRFIGLNKKGIFRLTMASYKALKKELTQKGIIWRFDNSRHN